MVALPVEWVFPGHGMWRHTDAEEWTRLMSALGPAMRELGRLAWARRPGTPYDWYCSHFRLGQRTVKRGPIVTSHYQRLH